MHQEVRVRFCRKKIWTNELSGGLKIGLGGNSENLLDVIHLTSDIALSSHRICPLRIMFIAS